MSHTTPDTDDSTGTGRSGSTSLPEGGSPMRSRCRFGLVVWGVTILFVALVLLANRIWSLEYFSNDAAYFDYTYTLIGSGKVPYADFFVIHGPITYWVAGLFQAAGPSPIGVALLGIVGYVILVSSTISLAFRACGSSELCRTNSPDAAWIPRLVRCVSIAILVATVSGGWYLIAWFVPFGGRPKFLAVGLLMYAVTAMSSRRAILAGILLALACWTWQAAVVQAAGLVLVWTVLGLIKRSRTVWPDLLKLIIAGLIVSAVCILILFWQGAWQEFLEQAAEFPIKYQRHTLEVRNFPARGIMRLLVPAGLLWRYLPKSFLVVVAASLLGWIMVLGRKASTRNGSNGQPAAGRQQKIGESCVMTAQVGIITLLVFGYLQLVSVTHGPGYVVPLLAPFGPLAGWVACQACIGLKGRQKWMPPALLLISVLLLAHSTWQSYGRRSPNPKQTDGPHGIAEYHAVADQLKERYPGPIRMVIHGDPRLRALLGGEPLEGDVQWIYGRYRYINATYEGGTGQYAEDLIAEAPDVVYISERALTIEPDMLQAMGDTYVRSPDLELAGRPLYIRVDE
ncbi:MAG: hypothetical protein D8M59_15055 [Planctomycetes bacterium]|nr:hypothetical protein [Planctomycetota bacterium]